MRWLKDNWALVLYLVAWIMWYAVIVSVAIMGYMK